MGGKNLAEITLFIHDQIEIRNEIYFLVCLIAI